MHDLSGNLGSGQPLLLPVAADDRGVGGADRGGWVGRALVAMVGLGRPSVEGRGVDGDGVDVLGGAGVLTDSVVAALSDERVSPVVDRNTDRLTIAPTANKRASDLPIRECGTMPRTE